MAENFDSYFAKEFKNDFQDAFEKGNRSYLLDASKKDSFIPMPMTANIKEWQERLDTISHEQAHQVQLAVAKDISLPKIEVEPQEQASKLGLFGVFRLKSAAKSPKNGQVLDNKTPKGPGNSST